MLEQLPSLIELQRHDTEVDALLAKVASFDPLIKKKNAELESLRANLKTAKESLTANQLKKKELEGEVEAKEKLIQKHNAELNSLKSNDAYKAMLGEIKAAKDAATEIEDKILAVMESIEAGDRQYKEAERRFKSDEAAFKADVQRLESEKAAAAAVAAKRKEERDAFAKTLAPQIVGQYDSIRANRGGLAIVPLSNNSCGGCHMSLPPHKVNDVKKAKAVVYCDSCSRMLYAPAQPADAAGAGNAVSPASTPSTAS